MTHFYYPVNSDGTHVMVEITKDILIKWANDFSKVEGVDLVKDKRSWRATRPEIVRRLALGLGPPTVRVNIFRRLSKLFSALFRARLFRGRDGRR
jgi:predicted transcriptional regulator